MRLRLKKKNVSETANKPGKPMPYLYKKSTAGG